MNLNPFKINIFIALIIVLFLTSCGIYSFTGASISPDVKTISIHYIKNQTPLAPPTYSQILTEAIKRKFSDQTSLLLVNENGDLDIEGFISLYSISQISITGNQTAAQERLTVTVNIKFRNEKDPKQNYQASFSRYADFNAGTNLSSVQDDLIEKINEALVEDIFTKSVVNW